jgi:hypothetical protein
MMGRESGVNAQEGEVIFVPSGWHHQVVNIDFVSPVRLSLSLCSVSVPLYEGQDEKYIVVTPQCVSINHNCFSSVTLPRVYDALHQAQGRVEESIADVKVMIRERHSGAPAPPRRDHAGAARTADGLVEVEQTEMAEQRGEGPEVEEWEREWVQEVQKLLEMDAGWDWLGFLTTVLANVKVGLYYTRLRV